MISRTVLISPCKLAMPGLLPRGLMRTGLDPETNDDKMMFGGRKRPLLLNLQWVQKWLEICDKDHNSACQLAENQGHVRRYASFRKHPCFRILLY
jgi:hypothetical protein